MRQIDRFNLIDRIGRELQSRMSYSDIDVYLTGFGINCSKETSSINSKWIYVKELLADVDTATIIRIADELEVEHSFSAPRSVTSSETRFWLAGHFRLFLSHVSSYKESAAHLQGALRKYGISAFVAHEDIEPTQEWLDEIEKALFTMDALAALVMSGFTESNWTDQEVGVAVGRDVLVIPIFKDLHPYGFISKYQGLRGNGKTVGEVADALFQIISNNLKTKNRMAEALVDQIILSSDAVDAKEKLSLLQRIETLPENHLEKIRDNLLPMLSESTDFLLLLNEMLDERGLATIGERHEEEEDLEDDIPF